MDDFKKANVVEATVSDYNVKCIILSNRSTIAKKLHRIARHKLKSDLRNELRSNYNEYDT